MENILLVLMLLSPFVMFFVISEVVRNIKGKVVTMPPTEEHVTSLLDEQANNPSFIGSAAWYALGEDEKRPQDI